MLLCDSHGYPRADSSLPEDPYGTTAYRVSYGRRNAAESGFSALNGWFSSFGRKGFVRVMATMPKIHKERGREEGITLRKIALLLGAFLAAYNLFAANSFNEKREREASTRPRRRSRRTGTFRVILQPRDESGRAPPD